MIASDRGVDFTKNGTNSNINVSKPSEQMEVVFSSYL